MYKFFSKFKALLMVSIMAISLTACASQTPDNNVSDTVSEAETTATETPAADTPAETVKLKMYAHYTSEDEKSQLDYAMAEMKKIMPNVEIEVDVMPQDSGAKLKTYFATGSLPDIFEVSTSDIATAVNSNSAVPLDDYIQKLNIADQLTPTGQSLLMQQDGHTWGIIGSNTNFAVIYVNKALFEEAGAKVPENYEEFLQAGELLKAKGIVPLGIWLKETWPPLQLFDMFSLTQSQKGITDLDLNGTANASDPAYLNAASKIQEIANKGLISKDAFSMDYDSAVADFKSGKSAMLLCGNWMAQEFGDTMGDDVTLLLPYVLADASEAQAVKDSGVMSGGGFTGGFAVAANSQYKDIAAEYAVQFALKNIEARIVKTGELNTMLEASFTPEKAPNALTNQLSEAVANVKYSTIMGWGFESSKIQTDLGSEVQKLFTGEYAPDEFATNVNAFLEKNRQ
ncbi:ABC transporter substrate-binding protein [Kineothrix sp. MB12-C1]|uniref:ABC transporter substrate-binding protein n=1 Tax=Kineothrix sp. MB12-C1 TaxID=3070215 RepID=UPI0027D28ECA|nr:extracellular solute-binding protein [Kineothrix sp. MB12-C1]WMC94193.1 extracellular solute-binding protein [Kineothrix sp. MB12-C1]